MTSISFSDNLQPDSGLFSVQQDPATFNWLPTLMRGLTMVGAAALISFALFQLMAQLVQSTAPITAKVDTGFDVTPLVGAAGGICREKNNTGNSAATSATADTKTDDACL